MDIDIDLAEREDLLNLIDHIPAAIIKNDKISKHNTGVYFVEIPVNPFSGTASVDYKIAEDRGYFKIDFLNVYIYKQVKSEEHLLSLMRTPDWSKLTDKKFVEQLIHVNNYFDIISKLPEPIDSIEKLAMFLASIRPSKKYLLGKTWAEVEKSIWKKELNGDYAYKKSHAISYAHLVAIHMNLLEETN